MCILSYQEISLSVDFGWFLNGDETYGIGSLTHHTKTTNQPFFQKSWIYLPTEENQWKMKVLLRDSRA